MARKQFVHLYEGLAGYMPDFASCTHPTSTIPSDITYGLEEHYINVHDEDPPEDDLAFLEEAFRNRQDAIVYCQHPNCLFYVSIEFYDEEEHSKLGCELNEGEE